MNYVCSYENIGSLEFTCYEYSNRPFLKHLFSFLVPINV